MLTKDLWNCICDYRYFNTINTVCKFLPFQGDSTYFAVVHLASLVPASKLTPVSTVCSACVSHLRTISEVTPQAELECIIHSLCSWNRFADIQDIVIDWLDQAFRCEGLNQSQAQVSHVLFDTSCRYSCSFNMVNKINIRVNEMWALGTFKMFLTLSGHEPTYRPCHVQ